MKFSHIFGRATGQLNALHFLQEMFVDLRFCAGSVQY